MANGPRLRPELANIPLYKAGQGPAARDDLETFKLSSNENPYPPLPNVREVIAKAGALINRYPDPSSSVLLEAIARYHGVPVEHVAVGTGAVALCYQVAHSTAGPGDEVLFAWRSFEAYPIVSRVAGATPVMVDLTADGHHDLAAMARAITARTRLIFVCSPNNPTGTTVSADQFAEFMTQVPDDVLVVLDEAYAEFDVDADSVNGIQSYSRYANVAVLRTFSKAYGLAGLRVGYALAPEPIVEALRKTALPFGVSNIAQAAAIASLADDAELLERVDTLVAERARITVALRANGWQVADSQANFVWLATGDRTGEFARACDAAGLTVRAFPGEGVRVTIAETAANDRFVEVAAAFGASPTEREPRP